MDTQWKIGAAALAAVIAAAGAVVACSSDPTAPQSTMYVARMSGANEVPRVTVGASGTATLTLTGRTLSYVVTVNGLSGNAAASHIHVGAAGSNGGIVVPFNAAGVQSGQVASGTVDLTQPISNGTTSISGDSLLTLLNNGLLYTNVHTAANPGGEIRGQITRAQSSNGY
jgi:Cu/Zn superoxide dismutase